MSMKIITGTTDDEIWQQVSDDLLNEEDVLEYTVLIKNAKEIMLDIDIDPGGGFEGGYEITTFNAHIDNNSGFQFKMHDENFIDDIGEFFGMHHLKTGDEDFDKKAMVKTNDEEKAKVILSDNGTKDFFKSMKDYSLSIRKNEEDHQKKYLLELAIDEGITEPKELKIIYEHFYSILDKLEPIV